MEFPPLQLANELTDDSRVLIITKSMKRASNSYRAQGGIAAAVGSEDTPTSHYKDTIAAGCNFHNDAEVRELVENGSSLIQALMDKGVRFDDRFDWTACHLGWKVHIVRSRIVHCGGDATGKHVVDHLISSLREDIDIVENRFVYELIIHPVTKSVYWYQSERPMIGQ